MEMKIRKTTLMIEVEEVIQEPLGEFLIREYLGNKRSAQEISKKVVLNEKPLRSETIRYWLKKYNIPIRTKSESKLQPDSRKPSREELFVWYIEEEKSMSEIGSLIGVKAQTINDWLRKHKIPTRSILQANTKYEKPSREELEDLYLCQRLTCHQIAKKLSPPTNELSHATVLLWLRTYGIPRRKRGPFKKELVVTLK